MSDVIDTEVAIVGCGPVGALTANLLGLQGVRVLVLERDTAEHGQPRAFSCDDEALRIYQMAGLAETLHAAFGDRFGVSPNLQALVAAGKPGIYDFTPEGKPYVSEETVALLSVVALALVDLREKSRLEPDAPAEAAGLTSTELRVLRHQSRRPLTTVRAVFLALAALDRGLGRLGGPLLVFGRVPLFFYLLQWPLEHGLAVAFTALRGQPPGYGQGLPVVYLMTAVTLALLYYPCRWFADVKRRRRDTWLSYF